MELRDKIIVLTGGTSGIGFEILKELSQKNTVIVLARHLEKTRDLISERIHPYSCDLASLNQLTEVADQILKHFPEIDVLINNAAVQYTPTFLDSDFYIESVQREITINLTSVCYLTHCLLPSLIKQTGSVIMNVNTGLALAPKTTSAVYCATKAALDSFSRSLNYQLEETNVRVLQAFMPLVDTPMTTGRGRGKISASEAACALIKGIESEALVTDIGKVRILRKLFRLSPALAYNIMKRG